METRCRSCGAPLDDDGGPMSTKNETSAAARDAVYAELRERIMVSLEHFRLQIAGCNSRMGDLQAHLRILAELEASDAAARPAGGADATPEQK